ncbi:MAG: hypothetical protein ABIG91_04225 [Patescibacteria group bacterium]
MKKYTTAVGIALLAIIIIFTLFQISFGDKKHKGGTFGNPISEISTKSIKDEEIKSLIEAVKKASEGYVEPQQSSAEKIYTAFASGKINTENYVLLSLTALYGDVSSLPTEYQGADDTSKDYAFMYGLINAKWGEFSEEAKEQIRPFLVSPTDPKSYFYLKSENSKNEIGSNILKNLSIPDLVHAEEAVVIEIPSIQAVPRIDVYYYGEEQKQSAEWAAQGIRDALPKFTGLFGFEHKVAYVSIVGEELKADGEASMDEYVLNTCQIKVRKQNEEKNVKTTAAHELFHCYQFWYGLVYEKPDTMWLMETTATWSEDYVYKGYATEHNYDKDFFPVTNIDVVSIRDNHEYGLYLWYFFLEQRAGAHEIMEAIKFGKTNGVRQGTQARENFGREYRDFAMWNWNRDPFKQYLDMPAFPDVSPYWGSVMAKNIEEIGETSYPVKLAKGGVLYNFMTFDNEEIKLIEFFPRSFTGDDENSLAGLQVLYKVNGTWNYEDWTGLEKRDFCRELDEENIQLVVLVTSNANLSSELDRPIQMRTTEKCSPGWKGSIKVEWAYGNLLDIGFSKGTYTEKGAYNLYETLEYDPKDDALVVTDQKYFGNYEEFKYVEGVNKDCGQLWSKNSKKLRGSGFVDYKKTGDMPERAKSWDDKEVNRLGGTYRLFFKIFGLKDSDKFAGSDLLLQMHKSCWGGIIVPEADGLVRDPYEYTTDSFKYEPNEVEINIDPKASHISGEDKFKMYNDVYGIVKWNYRKIE